MIFGRWFGRWLSRCFIIGLTCCLLVSCSIHPSVKNNLRIGTDQTFPPFEFQGVDGKLQGFSIDLIQAIANAAQFQIEFQSLPFDGIIPALQAQTIDAAISSITITEERAKTVAFSRPYFKAGLAIATRTDNKEINNFASLENKKIAVQIGTTGAQTAKNIPGAEVRSLDSAPLALQELVNGNVDAVINDEPVTLYAINTGNLQGIKVLQKLLTEEFYGIATTKKSPYLSLINQGLNTVIENGTYAKIYQKWFNATPPILPEKSPYANQGKNILNSQSLILQSLPILLNGVLVTLQLAFLSVFLGLIAGSLIGIIRLSPTQILQWIARAYIDFFRGTPLLVQIFMVYFGLPAFVQELGFTWSLNRLAAGVIALTLNSAAYIAEIVRAGIQSIEIGQTEAARSLGLNPVQTMLYVIFPQAFRRMIPPLGNEFISLLKDTSLVAVIGFEELFRKGQLIVAENYRAFEIYTAVAVIYLCLTLVSSQVFSRLEDWMNPIKKTTLKE